MPSDLQSFLKRTAEIRQRKTLDQRVEAAQELQRQARRKVTYSDRRRERQVEVTEVDEEDWDVVDAIELSDYHTTDNSELSSGDSQAAGARSAEATGGPAGSASQLRRELRELIRSPGGLRKAFLLREILERPRF